jgi:hypothetical protein
MSSMLGRYLNRNVRVSIPTLFPDGPSCVAELVAVERSGVWLESPALTHVVYPDTPPESARVFIPFTQIAYIVGETEEPLLPETAHAGRAAPADKATTKEKEMPSRRERSGHRGTHRDKHHR